MFLSTVVIWSPVLAIFSNIWANIPKSKVEAQNILNLNIPAWLITEVCASAITATKIIRVLKLKISALPFQIFSDGRGSPGSVSAFPAQ
jgi:hypothetical protein